MDADLQTHRVLSEKMSKMSHTEGGFPGRKKVESRYTGTQKVVVCPWNMALPGEGG